MTTWPDTRRIIARGLAPFGRAVGTLVPDWQSTVTTEKPLLHLTKVGGSVDASGVQRTDRLKIDAYAIGEPAALEVAEAVLTYLVGHYHYVPDEEDLGLVDDVQVESNPVPVPQYHDDIALVTATYRLTCRPI